MFPAISKELIRGITRVSLLLGVFLAVAGWEHLGILPKIKWLFANWAKLKKYIFLSRSNTQSRFYTGSIPSRTTTVYDANGKGFIYDTKTNELIGEAIVREYPLSEKVYIIMAILSIILIFWSQQSILHWLSYPFRQFWNAIQIWGNISINPWWIILLIPVKSLGYFLWAFLTYFLIYALFLLSLLRSSANIANPISQRLTKKGFSWLLSFGLLITTILALITF